MITRMTANSKTSLIRIKDQMTDRIQIQTHLKTQRRMITARRITTIVTQTFILKIDANSKTLLISQRNDNDESRTRLNISKRSIKQQQVH